MARIKGGLNAKKKHNRVLKLSLIHIQMCIRDSYTAMENTEVFTDQVLPMVSTKWAVEGTTDFLEDSQNAFQNMKEDKDQALIKEFGERFLNAERKAMITTVPKPGLAEEIEKEDVYKRQR